MPLLLFRLCHITVLSLKNHFQWQNCFTYDSISLLSSHLGQLKSVVWLDCFGSLKGVVDAPLVTGGWTSGWELKGNCIGNCCSVPCGPLAGNATIDCVVLLCDSSSPFPKICEPLLRFTETEPGIFTSKEFVGRKLLSWGDIILLP